MHLADPRECRDAVHRDATADDEVDARLAAQLGDLHDVIGDAVVVDARAALQTERAGEVAAAEHHAIRAFTPRNRAQVHELLAVLEARDRLEVEEEVGVLGLILRVHLVLRGDVLGEGERALDHRSDDPVDADLLGLEEVTDSLAAADLDGQLHVRLVRDLDEPKQLVHAGALSLEFGLDPEPAVLLLALDEEVAHRALGCIHSS